MVRFWNRRTSLQQFFEEVGPPRGSKQDQYQDFQAVFNGHSSPEQGRRVLAWIIAEAEGRPIEQREVTDTHQVSYRLGQRRLGLWIVKRINEMGTEIEIQGVSSDG